MHISDILQANKPSFSFEFFPPKTPSASQKLFSVIHQLEKLHPSFVSVTCGAGGSTRELTDALVKRITTETSLLAVPHLTCVNQSKEKVENILEEYTTNGVSNLLALRGDLPNEEKNGTVFADFTHAIDLVKHIKRFNQAGKHHSSKGFGIGVAAFPEGHPSTPNRLLEMDYLKKKVDAGADYICTQLFFDNHDFFDFRERCLLAGITIPIIAGIMPITSMRTLQRMAQLAAGAHFPAPLLRAIHRAQNNPQSLAKVGIHHAAEQCRNLLDNHVDGIHFYTLNDSYATREIYASLGMERA